MSARTIARLGILTSVALVLGWLERLVPIAPGIPGIKLGLGNTVLLYAIYMMKNRHAVLLMLLKVFLTGILFAGFVGMLYSFAGGVVSLTVMILAKRIPRIGIIPVSMLGAVGHSVGQITVACILLLARAALFYFPVLFAASVITGALSGLVAKYVLKSLQLYRQKKNIDKPADESGNRS